MLSTHSQLVDSFEESQSSISESKLIREILKYISYNSCVLFDYDNTLGEPTHVAATDEMFEMLFQFASLAMNNQIALNIVVMISRAFHYHTDMLPVEKSKTTQILKILNDINIPTLLVTLRGIDLMGCTEQQLDRMKLQFSDFWPRGTFKLDVGTPIKPVIYSNGKLFCNGHSKAECIKSFFNYIQYQPKNVTMLDDKVHHLSKSKKMFTEDFHCEFHGVHYRHLDEKVAYFKENFDLHAVVPDLKDDILHLKSKHDDISLCALRAIDRYSLTVLNKKSLFKDKKHLKETEKMELNHSVCQIKM